MLRKINREDQYSCPIAMYENWSNLSLHTDRTAKYEACPLKLAGLCYFEHDKVEEGLRVLFSFGRGRFMSKEERFTFSQLAHHHCDADITTWNFVRHHRG